MEHIHCNVQSAIGETGTVTKFTAGLVGQHQRDCLTKTANHSQPFFP